MSRIGVIKLAGRRNLILALADKSFEIRLLENKESLLVSLFLEVSPVHKLEINFD